MIKALLNEISANGDIGAVVPVSCIEDLKREMEDLKSEEHHKFSDWMAGGIAIGDELSFKPRSIIPVITRSPKAMLHFNHHGRLYNCVVPPFYTHEASVSDKVLGYISSFLKPLGYKAAEADRLPLKLLAVRSGLGMYGRNNICFTEEFGSHIRILAYLSDLPCDNEAPWFESRRMETCESCAACIDACPTKAIDSKNKVIDAAICLTALNEATGEFPDWVDKAAHNSVVGCTKCQDCCPGNAHVTNKIIDGVTFTEEETAELLRHKENAPYSDALSSKLEATGLSPWFIKTLPRNLGALLI